MAELFRPSEHEPLGGAAWDAAHAEDAIRTIVADAEAAFDGTRWPWHPRDGQEHRFTDVYSGGAGMIWALYELGSTGWEDAAVAFLDRRRADPPADGPARATSYTFGECGIALVAYLLTRDAGIADRLHELVVAEVEPDSNEVMSGTPGTLLAAEAMHAWTREPRWDEAWQERADRVEPHATTMASGRSGSRGTSSGISARRTATPATCAPLRTAVPWRRPTFRRTCCAAKGSPTGRPGSTACRVRFACSGATARPGWSRRSAICSISTWLSRAAS